MITYIGISAINYIAPNWPKAFFLWVYYGKMRQFSAHNAAPCEHYSVQKCTSEHNMRECFVLLTLVWTGLYSTVMEWNSEMSCRISHKLPISLTLKFTRTFGHQSYNSRIQEPRTLLFVAKISNINSAERLRKLFYGWTVPKPRAAQH